MANIRFLYDNKYTATATVLAASSSVSALPVSASQNPDRSYGWRSSTGTGVQTIDIDLGSVLAVTACALANVRVLGAGVVELYQRGDAASAGAATLVATFAAQDRDTRAAAVTFATQSHRHWQLKWTNPGSASDYAEVGYVFLGTYVEPTVNVMVPIPQSRVDPSIESMSSGGQKSYSTKTAYMTGALKWDAVLVAQLDQLRTMFDAIGVRTPLFILLDSALSWTLWYARLTGPLQWEHEPGGALARYGATIAFEEAR